MCDIIDIPKRPVSSCEPLRFDQQDALYSRISVAPSTVSFNEEFHPYLQRYKPDSAEETIIVTGNRGKKN